MTDEDVLPLAQRSDADVPGHWLLARLGKRVLHPGGRKLTTRLLSAAGITGADVVELGPGLGRTAREIVALKPKSYVGVDDNAATTSAVEPIVSPIGGRVTMADASAPGLAAASADVVVGEAMLTMQSDKAKQAIVKETYRILRPGGRYAIHELALLPDSLPDQTKDAIRRDLARVIKVNARPLTVQEWIQLLTDSGFKVVTVDHAPMALLRLTRVVADEGILGTLRIIGNLIVRGEARKRVLSMRRTFTRYRQHLTAVAIVAVVPD